MDTYIRQVDHYLTMNPEIEKKHLDIHTSKEDNGVGMGVGQDNRHVLRVLADIASISDDQSHTHTHTHTPAHTPLYQLKVYMESLVRVRVVIRRRRGIRGYVEGYVHGLDKHWNLLMRDADEVYVPNQVCVYRYGRVYLLYQECVRVCFCVWVYVYVSM
ncbi:hypothetical protein EON65_34405 [archaeon]|nr:MAG: hypothetical protein EON65_34405 [archaeon]